MVVYTTVSTVVMLLVHVTAMVVQLHEEGVPAIMIVVVLSSFGEPDLGDESDLDGFEDPPDLCDPPLWQSGAIVIAYPNGTATSATLISVTRIRRRPIASFCFISSMTFRTGRRF